MSNVLRENVGRGGGEILATLYENVHRVVPPRVRAVIRRRINAFLKGPMIEVDLESRSFLLDDGEV